MFLLGLQNVTQALAILGTLDVVESVLSEDGFNLLAMMGIGFGNDDGLVKGWD